MPIPRTSISTPRRSQKNCGNTVERDRDQQRADFGTASYPSDLRKGPSSTSAAVLASSASSCSPQGFSRAVVVDASSAYLAAASEEAARRGRTASTELVHGDFLVVASQLAPSTVVTLDRVVCCYPFYEPLLEQALQLAEHGVAFSYPRDRWFVRLGIWLENALRRRRGNPFRTFVHPPLEMTRMIERAGFTLASRRRTLSWSSDVFVKPS